MKIHFEIFFQYYIKVNNKDMGLSNISFDYS